MQFRELKKAHTQIKLVKNKKNKKKIKEKGKPGKVWKLHEKLVAGKKSKQQCEASFLS